MTTTPSADPIKLSDEGAFLAFDLAGKAFEVDVFAAMEAMVEIAAAHKGDAPITITLKDGTTKEHDSQRFLDDFAAWLVARYGLARCGRQAAAGVYNAVAEAVEGLKKKRASTRPSDIGSEWTQVDGPCGESSQ